MKKTLSHLVLLFCLLSSLSAQEIYYLEGSTHKISQLVGDYDKEVDNATQNSTFTNYQIPSTDLGIPFQHKGKTYLLFGDIPGNFGFGTDRDPIAYTSDTDPEDGIELSFITQSPGRYNPITIPGISQGAFEVPLDGISINDIMYIYHSTDNMTRSVLAHSTDDGHSFELLEDTISVNHFINISLNTIERSDYTNLPGSFEKGLIGLGSGEYRKSGIYLFCQNADSIAHKKSMHYFAGFSGGKPMWSKQVTDAVPVINTECAGELSVAYNPHLEKWLILYNCDDPRGIVYQTSDTPWGPYSPVDLLFDPWEDNAYCHFMHVNWEYSVCDSVHDPGRENEWGGEYGPYMFKEMTTMHDSVVNIYYTLSTWNPYTTVLMKSSLIKPEVVSSGIDPLREPDFRIFPNPTNSKFHVVLGGLDESLAYIVLYTNTGRKIYSGKYTHTIDLTTYPAGMYYGQILWNRESPNFFTIVKR